MTDTTEGFPFTQVPLLTVCPAKSIPYAHRIDDFLWLVSCDLIAWQSMRTVVRPATSQDLDWPTAGIPRRNERSFLMFNNMMNDGGMNGWMNGGMWVWPVLATLVAVLIVVVVIKLLKN